jgi:hypothetical protein
VGMFAPGNYDPSIASRGLSENTPAAPRFRRHSIG